jgi:hypothetical protein
LLILRQLSPRNSHPAESLQNKSPGVTFHTHGPQRRYHRLADTFSSFKGPPLTLATSPRIYNPRGDVHRYVFLLLQQQPGKNSPDTRSHFTSEPPVRTYLHRTRVPPKVLPAIYDVYRPRGCVRGYRASTSMTMTTQRETARHVNMFTGQPLMRRPSRFIGTLTRTTRSSNLIFCPHRGVCNSNSESAVTTPFVPKVLRTAQVKPRTRPRHSYADVEILLEDAKYPFSSTPAFMSPAETCKREQCLFLIYLCSLSTTTCESPFGFKSPTPSICSDPRPM